MVADTHDSGSGGCHSALEVSQGNQLENLTILSIVAASAPSDRLASATIMASKPVLNFSFVASPRRVFNLVN